jgi:hypothetical protein
MNNVLAHLDTPAAGRDRSHGFALSAWMAASARMVWSGLARPVLLTPHMLRDIGADAQAAGAVAPLDRREDSCTDALAGGGLSVADVLRFLRAGA